MEPSLEEHSSPEEEHPSPEKHPSPPQPTNPMNVGFALVAVFAIGLALGFLGRPQIIRDVPIQVVVTVVPENSSEAVAQAPASNNQSTSNINLAPSPASMSETNPTATQAEQETAVASTDSVQATPTIMDFVMADARHIDGNMDAPVTIVEFSDFK